MPDISVNDWMLLNVDLRSIDNILILKDTKTIDWHLIRFVNKNAIYKRVTLEIEFEPLPECGTHFYVNGWGGIDLAVIDVDGTIVKSQAIEATIEIKDCIFCLKVIYNSNHPSISIGMTIDGGMYKGRGQEQFAIHRVSFEVEQLRCGDVRGNRVELVDVGAAGGLQASWLPHLDQLGVTMIEPSQNEAARLRNMFPNFRIIESALSNRSGKHQLRVTKFSECSSLLEPNVDELSKYRAAALFEVVDRIDVCCERYDTLNSKDLAPAPDVLKLDVQGAEYEVLEGFGDLLTRCIGVELESHFYEIYQGQRLIGDIIDYLAKFDLRLRRLEPQMSFDADMVEVNAFFTRPRAALSPERSWKLDLVEKVWQLGVSDSVLNILKKFDN